MSLTQQQREVKASHTGKEIGRAIKSHLRWERVLQEKPILTVSPDIRNGHGLAFNLKFEMECLHPDELRCRRPVPVEVQAKIIACLQGDEKLRAKLVLLLRPIGLGSFTVEAVQEPRDGRKDFRCTIKKS